MITQYKCEYCLTVFEDEKTCKEHEEQHVKASDFTITKVGYDSGYNNIFPHFVQLSTTDSKGKKCVCVYAKARMRLCQRKE